MSQLESPKLLDVDNVTKLLKSIGRKEVYDANALTDVQKYNICKLVRPDLAKKFDNQRNTRSNLDKSGLAYHLPNIIAQMFINTIWWETYGPGSFDYDQTLAEQMKAMKSFRRKIERYTDEMKHMESESNKIKEEKGLVTQQEVDRLLEEQKQKHNEQMDQKHIEDRNAYKTLQKRLADLKSYNNELQSKVGRLDIDIKYLKNENDDLIKQISTNSLPPQ